MTREKMAFTSNIWLLSVSMAVTWRGSTTLATICWLSVPLTVIWVSSASLTTICWHSVDLVMVCQLFVSLVTTRLRPFFMTTWFIMSALLVTIRVVSVTRVIVWWFVSVVRTMLVCLWHAISCTSLRVFKTLSVWAVCGMVSLWTSLALWPFRLHMPGARWRTFACWKFNQEELGWG